MSQVYNWFRVKRNRTMFDRLVRDVDRWWRQLKEHNSAKHKHGKFFVGDHLINRDACAFWQFHFGSSVRHVPTAHFFDALHSEFNDSTLYLDLKPVLDRTDDGYINCYELQSYCSWFGPDLEGSFSMVRRVINSPWWKGPWNRRRAESFLRDVRTPDTYLIRFCEEDPDALVLSYRDVGAAQRERVAGVVQSAGTLAAMGKMRHRNLRALLDSGEEGIDTLQRTRLARPDAPTPPPPGCITLPSAPPASACLPPAYDPRFDAVKPPKQHPGPVARFGPTHPLHALASPIATKATVVPTTTTTTTTTTVVPTTTTTAESSGAAANKLLRHGTTVVPMSSAQQMGISEANLGRFDSTRMSGEFSLKKLSHSARRVQGMDNVRAIIPAGTEIPIRHTKIRVTMDGSVPCELVEMVCIVRCVCVCVWGGGCSTVCCVMQCAVGCGVHGVMWWGAWSDVMWCDV
jgi:CBL proto-oncogene N-terminus, EF hand-like domain/SH2 domain